MDIYSKLDGTVPISSPPGGVWKIRKKSKTDDQGRHRQKKRGKVERDIQENLSPDEQEDKGEVETPDDVDEQIGYGSAKKKNRLKRKIDLTI